MSSEGRTLEQIKQDILLKQAILFERRLDEFLAMEDPSTSPQVRKEIFRSLIEGYPKEPDEEEIQSKIWDLPSDRN